MDQFSDSLQRIPFVECSSQSVNVGFLTYLAVDGRVLQGQRTNRDGIGAQVRVTTDKRTQLREVHGGSGYQSFYGKRLYFGLGTHAKVDCIEVRWIGGGTDIHRNIKADQKIHLAEGKTLGK